MASSELSKIKPKELERKVRSLLGAALDDRALLAELEALGRHHGFYGLTFLWGPVLHKRNPVLFRPFILAHFSTHRWTGGWRYSPVRWQGDLTAWLAEVDGKDDMELFQRLWYWKVMDAAGWRTDKANKLFVQELQRRLTPNLGAARWRLELRKLDVWFQLDEPTAIDMLEHDPAAAGPFILKHLPFSLFKPVFWDKLFTRALKLDEELAFRLYRRQVTAARWEADVLDLARTVSEPGQLLRELERRHPEGLRRDPGMGLSKLCEARGRDVLPYVKKHVGDVWSPWLLRGNYGKLVDLALRENWMDLWSALVRICANRGEFNDTIRKLVADRAMDEQEVLRRLLALAGVGRELNIGPLGLAHVKSLEESTAVALYERFPALVRGPFKLHLQVAAWSDKPVYERLVDRALALQDEELLDFLASRFLAVRRSTGEVAKLTDHYRALKEDGAFARRAAAVLTRVPAYTLPHYGLLIRENSLARLLFERSARSFLDSPEAVADLVEGSEIHVQALAYRVLSLDDERARAIAREHLSLLLATLLRPLHRITRALAFEALANVAGSSLEVARTVHERARRALSLPDERYPKEKLVGLLGRLLHRWPELRSPAEQPVVYR